jgi:hypothetical protein
MNRWLAGVSALMCGLSAGALLAPAQDRKPAQAANKADLDAFRAYLAKNHPGKKWRGGPQRIDSEEIRKAYGERRFYYVFSPPPLPPGAPSKERLEGYRRAVEEHRKLFLSLVVSVDDQGKVTPVRGPAELNEGLMKVASDEDARLAAAAILALRMGDRVGPGPVPVKSISATRSEKGWTCRTNTPRGSFQGTVTFNAAGRCTAASKVFTGPLPP